MLGGALFVAAIALPLLRQSGARSWQTVWAEDGLFGGDALRHGWGDLLRGYSGYAQLVPRAIAVGVRDVPVGRIAQYFALAASVVGAAVALFVYHHCRGWIRSPFLRVAIAASTVLAPVLLFENTANITNSIWVLMFGAFWAILSTEQGRWAIASRAAMVFLAVTSLALTALLLPLAAAIAFMRRGVDSAIVLGALLAGIAVQGVVVLHTTSTYPELPSKVSDLPAIVAVRVFGSALVGDKQVKVLWPHFGLWLALAFAIAAVVVAAALALGSGGRGRQLAAIAGAHAMLLVVVPIWLRGTTGMHLGGPDFAAGGARYAVVPVLLVICAAAALADDRERGLAGALVMVQIAVVLAFSFSATNFRSSGPTWEESLRAARAACAVDRSAPARVPITPAGWFMSLDCGHVMGHRYR
jgi:hypothetical protein